MSSGRAGPGALRVAPLTAADVPRYRTLMLHAYEAAADAFTSTAAERANEPDAWWAARIADPRGLGQAFGAFVGDELAGTVAIEFSAKPKTRHKALLLGMFVHAWARGQGAGRALVDTALAAAGARPGVQLATLTVTEGNAPAIALYERCGFRAFGLEPLAIATPQGLRGKVHMWRPLVLPAPEDAAVQHYVDAWQAADEDTARRHLARCWDEDSEIVGPGYRLRGLQPVLDEIARFRRERPGWTVGASSGFDAHGRWVRFAIVLTDPAGVRRQEGLDVVELDDRGRIRRVVTFWGPLT